MKSASELRAFLQMRIAEINGTDPAAVSVSRPLYVLGVDSMTLVAISAEMEIFLERPIDTDMFSASASIDKLVALLVDEHH